MSATDTTPTTVDATPLTRKDFASDREVRWCPGCGDYAILATIQGLLAEVGARPERTVFVSGIGCSSRFPYYMNTFGMHTIHGRAPTVATGLAITRPDLDVWVVTGDGDGLSIGGNHLMHALRRNVNLNVLLFNNEIYGLTKGQYSPTSPLGAVHKSTPMGSVDRPVNPVSLALGAEATFVARSIDADRAHLTEVLRAAYAHRGTSFVEIYQNCVVFNDDAFIQVTGRETKAHNQIRLRQGQPIVFGPEGEHAVVSDADGSMSIVPTAEAGDRIIVHDAARQDPTTAFALARLAPTPDRPTPIGVFRAVEAPVYDDLVREQVTRAQAAKPADLRALLDAGNVWDVA
jgi:2-oxoglutarate/2-oxoacid ferredoxin oxidoreductase subunit beta